MPDFEPQTPDYAKRVEDSFARQSIMDLIGARLATVAPGHVEIELPYRADLTQQHDYLHAGVVTTIADSAGGYAAFSLMPGDASVLAVEFKVNLIAPAKGRLFRAIGRVKRPGRRLTVSEIEVLAVSDEGEKACLVGLHTSICLPNTADLPPTSKA